MCGKGHPLLMDKNIKDIKSKEFINILFKIVTDGIKNEKEGEKKNDRK